MPKYAYLLSFMAFYCLLQLVQDDGLCLIKPSCYFYIADILYSLMMGFILE